MSLPVAQSSSPLISREEIERAYLYCRQTARTHAKSFYFSARFLPRHKRRAIYAIYALCRHVDDAVDEVAAGDESEITNTIEGWKNDLDRVYLGEIVHSPILVAWRDMLEHYPIKQELPFELMQGVLMDTHTKRYATWAELRVYCYRVASVVGLMSSEVFGYTKLETLAHAESLGYAMQLTNILRDIGEDSRANRIYIPQEDLQRFGYTESELMRGEVNENFRHLMNFEIERARSLYREAERGIPLLNREARFTVLLAARLYAKILDKIEHNDYDVFTRRAHLNFVGKLRYSPRLWREARRL